DKVCRRGQRSRLPVRGRMGEYQPAPDAGRPARQAGGPGLLDFLL
ncbi:MAG: hypothetical protein AVDCRST_MAG77-5618, partial [uncultured Chloroflexi bacterium]